MQTLFIEAKYHEKFKLPKQLVDRLPNTITLATTIQFIDSIENIKSQLEQAKKEVKLFKGEHAKYPGQMLGCSLNKQEDTDAFLYIGSGEFHPKALLLKNSKPVFVYNPLNDTTELLTEKDIELIKRKQQGALSRYLVSDRIGIIVSTKPGQNHLKEAETLQAKLQKEKKEAYIFVTDTLSLNELENFPFIQCWVNTMCPRIGYDDGMYTTKPILNLIDLQF